jgi:hypothetical protein
MSAARALAVVLVALAVRVAPAAAHSASDAYLTLTVAAPGTSGPTVLHGEWDIALRDLDFVLRLDADGDGELTWGEVRRRSAEIARYAYAALALSDGAGQACTLVPGRLLVAGHADGAYAALFFDARCARTARVTLDYRLFFAVDPSHRGLLVLQSGGDAATAVLAPDHARVSLPL